MEWAAWQKFSHVRVYLKILVTLGSWLTENTFSLELKQVLCKL